MVRKRKTQALETCCDPVEYIPCFIKEIEDDADFNSAAKFAQECNPANTPNVEAFCSLGIELDKFAIAVMTTKYFGPGGVKLTVSFVETTTAALQEKILLHMNAWGTFCNAKFSIFQGAVSGADVRISRGGSGYWSYLGTDVLHIPRNQPTMNLQGFTLNTPESEYRRVIRHETGHTLGCPHEHMRREIVAKLDVNRTIAYFGSTQGWSPTDVRQQVLTPIEESSLLHTAHAEVDSIMCYGLPASITVDNTPIPGGTDITASDGAFMATLYPLSVVPPPPQPPPSVMEIIVPRAGTYRLIA